MRSLSLSLFFAAMFLSSGLIADDDEPEYDTRCKHWDTRARIVEVKSATKDGFLVDAVSTKYGHRYPIMLQLDMVIDGDRCPAVGLFDDQGRRLSPTRIKAGMFITERRHFYALNYQTERVTIREGGLP